MRPKSRELENWIAESTDKYLCECGCGQYVVPTRHRYYQGCSMRFIDGHQNRGSAHPNYRGGVVMAKGYVWILKHDHLRCTPRGYVKRCCLVAEEFLGQPLNYTEVVHHINADKTDDRPENLQVTTRQRHSSEHNRGEGNPAYRHDVELQDVQLLLGFGLSQRAAAVELKCSLATVKRRLRAGRSS